MDGVFLGGSSLPRHTLLRETSQFRVARRRSIEHRGKALECVLGESKVPLVEQNRFCFPTHGFKHEIRAALSKGLRRTVDQHFLFLTGAQVDCLIASRRLSRDCPDHGAIVSQMTTIHKCIHTETQRVEELCKPRLQDVSIGILRASLPPCR